MAKESMLQFAKRREREREAKTKAKENPTPPPVRGKDPKGR